MNFINLFGKGDSIHQKTEKQIIGKIGEDYVCEHMKENDYKIIDRNYLKKWGEIDIVAKNGKKLHFIEVKTVSRNFNQVENVTHETDGYRPEDNMHPWKLQRLGRAIQSYLLDKDVSDETEWQFDVVTVYLDRDKRLIKIEILDDLVL